MGRKLALTAILLWAVTIGAAIVVFVRGDTTPGTDGRTAIQLAPADRDFVLGEMRAMLATVQAITDGIAEGNPAKVSAAATAAGGDAVHGVPPTLLAKLPVDFKRAGMAMHAGFDKIATAAEFGENPQGLTVLLADQLNACTGCHMTYRFDIAKSP
jgi:cytochrome c556